MGLGSFLKKAINPLTPFKQAKKIGKASLGAGKSLMKGNFKSALKQGLGAGTMAADPTGLSPMHAALAQRFSAKKKAPAADPMAMMGNPAMGVDPAQAVNPIQPINSVPQVPEDDELLANIMGGMRY